MDSASQSLRAKTITVGRQQTMRKSTFFRIGEQSDLYRISVLENHFGDYRVNQELSKNQADAYGRK